MLIAFLHSRYPNLHEVRLIPTKKDIAFVEYTDEASSTVAKDALHNYKLDGENKIKVRFTSASQPSPISLFSDHLCKEMIVCFSISFSFVFFLRVYLYLYMT